jgi:predicted nucleotidyltransferase
MDQGVTGMHPNVENIEAVVAVLGDLADEVVFLGGGTTTLLITDEAAAPVRASIDVDVIVDVANLVSYYRLSDALRERGFREDTSDGAPVCRWRHGRLILDVMPIAHEILGFSNRWYHEALDSAIPYRLPSGRHIRLVTAPHFLATKIEAFRGRGASDYLASEDIEDIVSLLDGRPEIVDEIRDVTPKLRDYLADELTGFLGNRDFRDALSGHLAGPDDVHHRALGVLRRIEQIAALKRDR